MATADREPDPRRVQLKAVLLSYPALRTKQAAVKDGTPKYGASFLMDPKTEQGRANVKACQKAVAAAEVETFGAGKEGFIAKAVQDPKRIALKKGEKCTNGEGEIYGGYEGMIALSTRADKRPKLLSRSKDDVDLEDIEDKFYGGVVCDAIVSFYCIKDKDKGGNGLFCSVEGIRSHEKGEPFGGGPRASADDFDDLGEDDGDDGLPDNDLDDLLGDD